MKRTKKLAHAQKQAAEILKAVEESDRVFAREIRNRFPWFDGSLRSWSRLRGVLSMTYHKDLDWWMDSCNEPMILGFIEAIGDDEDNSKPIAFEDHCEKCESQELTHRETAQAWLDAKPDDTRSLEDVKKASENYRAKRNREQKQRGETGNPL